MDLGGSVHYTDAIMIDVLTGVNENVIPVAFNLEQNFPNPFNPSTTISFAVPRATYVTIEVFNTLGERITTLFSRQVNTGSHTVVWNAAGQPSGLYIVRLSSAEFTASKKMLLSK